MQVSRWKRLLSYLTELHLESAPSDLNPHLYVSLRRGRFQLCTANAVYSYGDLYDNFSRAFQRLPLDKLPIQDVLLLGFGLGSIPLMLEKTFGKNYRYTGVEMDESVLYLANKYTLPDIQSSIELICADAAAFVQQTPEQYDLICMDVFLDDQIPDTFTGQSFLKELQGLLRPGGILLYNRLSATPEDLRLTRTFWENCFLPVFPQGACWKFGGNWILVSETRW
jgi:SAM-dependent methyltransferase